jgi:hypothetical protein
MTKQEIESLIAARVSDLTDRIAELEDFLEDRPDERFEVVPFDEGADPSHPFKVSRDGGLDVKVAAGLVRRLFPYADGWDTFVSEVTLTLADDSTNLIYLRLAIESFIVKATTSASYNPGTGDGSLNWDGDQILTMGYTINSAAVVSSTTELFDTFTGPGDAAAGEYVYRKIADVVTADGSVESVSQKLFDDYVCLLTAFTWVELGNE